MKTLKIFSGTFLILLLTAKSLFAGIDPSTTDNILYSQINKNIKYPEQARIEKIEGFVLVSFTVSNDGTLIITGMNSSNSLLKNYVEEKLKEIRMNHFDSSAERTFNVKFNFQLLKE